VVAKGVVVVAVGVDDRPDRQRRELAEVGQDLVGLAVGDPRIDDEHSVVTQDRPDVLVVEHV